MGPDADGERAFHHHTSSDTSSLRSFASSASTLALVGSEYPSREKYLLYDEDITPCSNQSQIPHWRKTPLRQVAPRLLYQLVPSFLQHSHIAREPRKLHPTSYLDGLRGVAALIVFIDHFSIHWFENLKFGYLSDPSQLNYLQLPFLRLIFSGRASVGVFFVISGFVLSYKPLLQIRSTQPTSVLATLSSSVFRRGLRLYLPIVGGTFISALLSYHSTYSPVPTRVELLPPIFPTLSEQLQHWRQCTYDLIYPFNWINPNTPYSPPYNGHLWTIPIEFQGSMVVFAILLMLSQVKSWFRISVISWLACWSLGKQRWDLFLFLSGTLLAELNLSISSAASHELPITNGASEPASGFSHLFAQPTICIPFRIARVLITRFSTLINTTLLLLSLYLLSYPGDGPSPGTYHDILLAYTPSAYTFIWYGPERFYLSLGSVLLIFTLFHSPRSQRLFNHFIPQYLGDISYPLYIVHGMVLFTLGTGLMERWTGAIGSVSFNETGQRVVIAQVASNSQYGKAFFMCGILNSAVVFWAADLFWRCFDRPSVQLARNLEELVRR